MIGQVLSANPIVAVYDDVFDAAVAAACIHAGQDRLGPAQVVGLGGLESSPGRSNRIAVVDQWADPVLTGLCETLSALVRLPPEHAEPAKLLHYRGVQKFDLHADGYVDYLPGQALALANGGQRLFTTICYLNTSDGGATVFPHLRLCVRPILGRVLLFANTGAGSTEIHSHVQHAGEAVNSGEKWVMSVWWRANMYHVPRNFPPSENEILTV